MWVNAIGISIGVVILLWTVFHMGRAGWLARRAMKNDRPSGRWFERASQNIKDPFSLVDGPPFNASGVREALIKAVIGVAVLFIFAWGFIVFRVWIGVRCDV